MRKTIKTGTATRRIVTALSLTMSIALPAFAGAAPQATVNLGSAAGYAVLADSLVTNIGSTTIDGDLGVNSPLGMVGAPDATVTGALHKGDQGAGQAAADLATAYADAAGRTAGVIAVGGNLAGQTLTAGLYRSAGDLDVKGAALTLDGGGSAGAVFILQVPGDLSIETCSIALTGGARACNVFWQVGGEVKIGIQSSFVGTVLADQWITLCIGAQVDGRLLSCHGGVVLIANTIAAPGACGGGRAVADFDNSGCTDLLDNLFLIENYGLDIGDGLGPIGVPDFLNLLDYWMTGPTCSA